MMCFYLNVHFQGQRVNVVDFVAFVRGYRVVVLLYTCQQGTMNAVQKCRLFVMRKYVLY